MGQLQDLRNECRELGISHTPKHKINQLTKKIQKFKMAEETKSGTISKAQIDAWKKEHGSVYKLEVKVSENDKRVAICANLLVTTRQQRLVCTQRIKSWNAANLYAITAGWEVTSAFLMKMT